MIVFVLLEVHIQKSDVVGKLLSTTRWQSQRRDYLRLSVLMLRKALVMLQTVTLQDKMITIFL